MKNYNKLKKALLICMLLSLTSNIFAKDLGVVGETYPIAELDLRQAIQQRLSILQSNGELDKVTVKFNHDLTQQMDRPLPVSGLQRSIQSRTWLFDPSIRMPYDLKNANGDVILAAGTTINPLDTIPLPEMLLFYNADDPEQVRWVQRQNRQLKNNDKLILVGGSVISQTQLFRRQIFFDQGGKLTTRFRIKHVPAIVMQQGNRLKIQEIAL